MSQIFDRYKPLLPKEDEWWLPLVPNMPNTNNMAPITIISSKELADKILELDKLLKEFREMIIAAKKLDTILSQSDCEDPEKAKILDRVEALERIVAENLPKKRAKKLKNVVKNK